MPYYARAEYYIHSLKKKVQKLPVSSIYQNALRFVMSFIQTGNAISLNILEIRFFQKSDFCCQIWHLSYIKRCCASRYFCAVLLMMSWGKMGPGDFLSQSRVSK